MNPSATLNLKSLIAAFSTSSVTIYLFLGTRTVMDTCPSLLSEQAGATHPRVGLTRLFSSQVVENVTELTFYFQN